MERFTVFSESPIAQISIVRTAPSDLVTIRTIPLFSYTYTCRYFLLDAVREMAEMRGTHLGRDNTTPEVSQPLQRYRLYTVSPLVPCDSPVDT